MFFSIFGAFPANPLGLEVNLQLSYSQQLKSLFFIYLFIYLFDCYLFKSIPLYLEQLVLL